MSAGYTPLRFDPSGFEFTRDALRGAVNNAVGALFSFLEDKAGDAQCEQDAALAESDLARFADWLEDNLCAIRQVAPDPRGHAADRACDLAREAV